MVSQYKAVSIFIFLNSFFINLLLQSKQLALPKQILGIVTGLEHKIAVNEFVAHYRYCLLSADLKDNIITHRLIFNNVIKEYYLLDNVPLLILANIGFLNNQFCLLRVLNEEKFFISTN